MRGLACNLGVGATLGAMLCLAPAGAQEEKLRAAPRQLSTEVKPWTGDFDAMLERRVIRILVPYSRTLYFVDKGRERGLTAELAREFENHLNTRYAKQQPGDSIGRRRVGTFLYRAHDLAAIGGFPMRAAIVLSDPFPAGIEEFGFGCHKRPFVRPGLILSGAAFIDLHALGGHDHRH